MPAQLSACLVGILVWINTPLQPESMYYKTENPVFHDMTLYNQSRKSLYKYM